MTEIDHDAAIAAVRYHAEAIAEDKFLDMPDFANRLRYVASLASAAKGLAEALEIARGALADIGLSEDMTLKVARHKALRIYEETGSTAGSMDSDASLLDKPVS